MVNQRYELEAITGHRLDPNDPARVEMRCQWTEGGFTWEPEEHLQLDAPRLWRSYIKTHNHRQVLGNQEDLWIVLKVKSHSKLANGLVQLRVSWVGSTEETTETESFVQKNRPQALNEYWMALGGRKTALGSRKAKGGNDSATAKASSVD
ncbi:hypothetical protein LY78DRAFT_687257 [Colletotrichum sublineola]|uniref:Chromo domain-containing protein n=1 Tax=Colletotrichum sublineola TaxID=1173701 RepID=A0A066XX13_COLSU|nr:hypothetical protein LY78DRAFT_687257 [Colletotrichum sublineola]KDN72204.1 hypothetical protein CSUB01_12297 [Colletotrichum sublineola]